MPSADSFFHRNAFGRQIIQPRLGVVGQDSSGKRQNRRGMPTIVAGNFKKDTIKINLNLIIFATK